MKKVIVAMSGGVDSSVAAALLVSQGFDTSGIFMKNWSVPINGKLVCPWEQDSADARAVAKVLGIPFYVMSFEGEYKKRVVDYMVTEYAKGRTPNPDIMCNSEIKFRLFLDKALSLGADYVATGHYARVREATSYSVRGGFSLLRGKDANKDQSYFLYRLGQNELDKLMFPIGEYTKPEVRELARKFRLPTAEKKDSTGVCFIGEFSMKDFLKAEIEMVPGPVVDVGSGKAVAQHDGIQYYTIGQRHGFGGGGGTPYYVADKDLTANTVYVAPGRDHESLMSNEIEVEDLHLVDPDVILNGAGDLTAKIRYRGEEYPCSVSEEPPQTVRFKRPAWAVTPGQSIVFFDGDTCLGGAVIKSRVKAKQPVL